jgi:SNF2 family DNA or RNA helicase
MNFKTTPYAHQREALTLSSDAPVFALLMEQGTGKTKVIIDTAAHLFEQGKITALLIVAPNGVHRNWISNEIPAHMPDEIIGHTLAWDGQKHGTKKAAEQREAVLKRGDKLTIAALNIDAMNTDNGKKFVRRFLEVHDTLWTLDESTRIKAPGAKRTKAVLNLAPLAKYRRILTGTPIPQGPFDFYAQFKFLDAGILGFSTFTAFKSHHGVFEQVLLRNGGAFQKVVRYQRVDQLMRKARPYSFRCLKSECLDLPEKVYQVLPVDMTPEQARIYEQVRSNVLVELETGDIAITTILTRLMRLQQIVGGFMPSETDDAFTAQIPGGNNRIKTVLDMADDWLASGKVIIWARFRAELDAIHAALRSKYWPDAAVLYHGGVPNDARYDNVHRFQDAGSAVKFFVGQPQSGGIGLTLTQGVTQVFYSNDFNLETRMQAEDRSHRIGTTKSVLYVDMITPGTIDEHVTKALRSKRQLADVILGDPERRWI